MQIQVFSQEPRQGTKMCITYKKRYICGHEAYVTTGKCEFSIAVDKLDTDSDPCGLANLTNKCENVSRDQGVNLEQEYNDCLIVQGDLQ